MYGSCQHNYTYEQPKAEVGSSAGTTCYLFLINLTVNIVAVCCTTASFTPR